MVNRDGQTKVKLPTQYRTKKSTKKVLKKEGDKHNYSIIKCVICNKQKMEKYDLIDAENNKVTIRKCKNCGFANASDIVFQVPESALRVNYFKPSGALVEDDKSTK